MDGGRIAAKLIRERVLFQSAVDPRASSMHPPSPDAAVQRYRTRLVSKFY